MEGWVSLYSRRVHVPLTKIIDKYRVQCSICRPTGRGSISPTAFHRQSPSFPEYQRPPLE